MITNNKNHNCASAKLVQLCLTLALTVMSNITFAQSNIITTICGQDTAGYNGDEGLAVNAMLYRPFAVLINIHDDIIIDDALNHRIRKIDHNTGIITTLIGTGVGGFSGDGEQATDAKLFIPEGFFIDSLNNIYIADAGNNRIRKVTAATGVITTVAGNGTLGYSGDGGLATNAKLHEPSDVFVDKHGNIYIAELYSNVIRKVDFSTGIISTVAGTGTATYSGDGGLATNANLNGPGFVAVDDDGNIFITDGYNNVIRKIENSTGIITTIAGTGIAGHSGDGDLAVNAQLTLPNGIFLDKNNNIFFAEYNSGTVRKIDQTTGLISTIAGTGIVGYAGDGGLATEAKLAPSAVCVSGNGNIFIADEDNNRIRKISASVGVRNIANTNNDAIYPNPSTGRFTVKTSNTALADVTICNTVGGTVATVKVDNNHSEIDISNQPNGVYFVNLKTDKDNHVYKVVLAK